jgi:glycosyltransferase involved in cell wall biosynthesis
MQISLIVTVLNEGSSIRPLMDSIVAQTRLPDEVVVCDGGSTDDTVAIIESYTNRLPLRMVVSPGANISKGRNVAINAASHSLIAATDAGVHLAPTWLENLIAPFEENPDQMVSAGFFLPDTLSAFEVAMGAAVLPALEDIDPVKFLPSSRSVAFRREAFEQIGGYPEWIDFCEDLIFDFRLHALYRPFAFVPDAVAYFKPRSSIKSFIRQYYLYARGDGKANLFFRRHLIRYAAYLVALPVIVATGVLINPWWLLALFAGGVYVTWRPYRRLINQWGHLPLGGKLAAFLLIPVIVAAGDLAKMVGYPVGVCWRVQNRPPDWRLKSF